jgi:hypothetical protein
MAHPDDGYMIPDEEWTGLIHPETGENLYPGDNFAAYRNFLIEMKQDESAGIVRADRVERLAKLRRLRAEALNGRLDSEAENAE